MALTWPRRSIRNLVISFTINCPTNRHCRLLWNTYEPASWSIPSLGLHGLIAYESTLQACGRSAHIHAGMKRATAISAVSLVRNDEKDPHETGLHGWAERIRTSRRRFGYFNEMSAEF